MGVLWRLRAPRTDHTGTPRPPALAAVAAPLVAVTLALASLGGPAGLAAIGILEAATAAGLLWAASR